MAEVIKDVSDIIGAKHYLKHKKSEKPAADSSQAQKKSEEEAELVDSDDSFSGSEASGSEEDSDSDYADLDDEDPEALGADVVAKSEEEKRQQQKQAREMREKNAPKKFLGMIYDVKLQNLERRSRNLQLRFDVGIPLSTPKSKQLERAAAALARKQSGDNRSDDELREEERAVADRSKATANKKAWNKMRSSTSKPRFSVPLLSRGSDKNKRYSTETIDGIESMRTVSFTRKASTSWRGRYRDLHKAALEVTLLQHQFGAVSEVNRCQISLHDIATGSVVQELHLHELSGGRAEAEERTGGYRVLFRFRFQELFCYMINFTDWRCEHLVNADAAGSSDPYIVWSIPPSLRHIRRLGGGRGRTTRTNVVYNTLFPSYSAAREPLYFYGTRWQLEEEVLRIDVIDWDVGGRLTDDTIGYVDVPLSGLLAGGRLNAELAVPEHAGLISAKAAKLQRFLLKQFGAPPPAAVHPPSPAGATEGGVSLLAQPPYSQFGDQARRLPGVRYLVLHLISAKGLRSRHAAGQVPDTYVNAVWDSSVQQSRVVRGSNSPTYDETLFFPVRLISPNTEQMALKGRLRVTVYDHQVTAASAAGLGEFDSEEIGFVDISLDLVTAAAIQIVDGVKTRVFVSESMNLQRPGVRRGIGSLSLRAYFTPDLADEVRLESRVDSNVIFSADFLRREREWRGAIPRRLGSKGSYLISAADETNQLHFLPTFLTKLPPPPELTDPCSVACMVRCISFELDPHLQQAADKERNNQQPNLAPPSAGDDDEHKASDQVVEVWSSPNYFMGVKKGASEDHAVLQCNLFLGMGLDAYVAIGRLPGGAQHVWVVTREPNGDVRFWETTKGCAYTLPGRWGGLYMEGGAALSLAGVEERKLLQRRQKIAAASAQAKRLRGKVAAAIALEKKQRADANQREATRIAHAKEGKLIFLADDETWDDEPGGRTDETPAAPASPRTGDAERGYESAYEQPFQTPRDSWGEEEELAASLVAHDRNRAAKSAKGKLLQATDKLRGGQIGAAARDLKEKASVERAAQAEKLVPPKEAPELHLPPCEPLAVESLEVLVNHENVWANVHSYHCHKISFELDDETLWMPFVKAGAFEPPPFIPFYNPMPIGAKLPPNRLASLRHTLLSALRKEYASWRLTRNLKVRWATRLEPLLEEGLRALETANCSSSPTAWREVDRWRGTLMAKVGPQLKFVGRAFAFSLTSPEKLVEYLLTKHKYHENASREARFGIAVQCFAHYCAVVSTRVYICCLTPLGKVRKRKKRRKRGKEEEESGSDGEGAKKGAKAKGS